jgi:hypothetical protein
MLAYSDFDMRDIGKKKTAVFMVIHDEKKTYHSLMTIFIKQCYETLIDVAQENGGKLSQRTNFILDEFANMPPLKDVDSMISAARSRDIRFTFIIQNFAQLNEVYGDQVAEVIKGNCGNIIYLISTELKALEEISKMCGEVKSKDKEKTASKPLVTVSDLQKLKLFQAIIIRLRMNPFKTQLEPYYKMNWGTTFNQASYPERPVKEIQLFDLKKFVTDEKRKQATDMGNEMNPNMMGGGFNPYGNPFMQGNPFGPTQNPFMNHSSAPVAPVSDKDIDEMMKEIDRKLKELDEQDNNLSTEDGSEKIETDNVPKEVTEPETSEKNNTDFFNNMENPFFEDAVDEQSNVDNEVKEEKVEEKKEAPVEVKEKKVEAPKENLKKTNINVDDDSVIVNENVVTDDEFFDDFFGDDDDS